MSMIQWSSRFELGIPFIDDDHRHLVSLVNRMEQASRSGGDLSDVGSILSALVDYTKYHFAREERAQAIAGYPDLAEHKEQHKALAGKAQQLFNDFKADPSAIDVGDLLDFLSDWLMDHILLHDMAIKPYVQASREAVNAAENVTYLSIHDENSVEEPVDWEKVSILVIEDSKAFASVLRAILRSVGVGHVKVAHSVEEAAIASTDHDFNLVLSDWRVQNKDGTDIIPKLRAESKETPVVMLTGYVDEGVEGANASRMAAEWLQKPITSTELTSCLYRYLN